MGMIKSRFTGNNKTEVQATVKVREEPAPPPLTPEEKCAIKLEELTTSLDCFESEMVDLLKDITDALRENNTEEKSDPEDEHQWLQYLDENTKLDPKTSKHLLYRIATKQEVLMQKLLSTDAIIAPTDDMRIQRKELVKCIQELEKKLDIFSKAIQKVTVHVEPDQSTCEEAEENTEHMKFDKSTCDEADENTEHVEPDQQSTCEEAEENTEHVESDKSTCDEADENPNETPTESPCEDTDEDPHEDQCEDPGENPDQMRQNASEEGDGQSNMNVDE